jgi:hypothetical protein
MQAMYEGSCLDRKVEKQAKTARIQWPISRLRELDKYKAEAKNINVKRWANLKTRGKVVSAYTENKVGNTWLMNPEILRPNKYSTALKMRANVAADKVTFPSEEIQASGGKRRE